MKKNILTPELYCTDIEKTKAFYVDILWFNIKYERIHEKFIYLEREWAEIMIEQLGVGINWITSGLEYPFGRGMNLQIEVNNIDEIYKKLKIESISLFLDLEEKWYEAWDKLVWNKQFIIQDPDGYLLRFFKDLWEK